jgi:uncharacterized membrane protein YqgA involved in biofilm formation
VAALSGTLLNAATVLIGGLLGTVVGDRLPDRLRENVVKGVGLFVTAMGVKFAIDTTNLLFLLAACCSVGSLVRSAGSTRASSAWARVCSGASRAAARAR